MDQDNNDTIAALSSKAGLIAKDVWIQLRDKDLRHKKQVSQEESE